MTPLSPYLAILGGLLIGSAAALMLLLSGRVAGVSGMAARAAGIAGGPTPRAQAAAFVLSLPLGAALVGGLVRQMLPQRHLEA